MTQPNDLESLNWDPPDDKRYADMGSRLGDRRDGRIYLHDHRIRAAILVAHATGRPLLVRGGPGSGKSSLAPFAARVFSRKFYSFTVTGRTQARDLMWQFDAVRRLSDAQIRRPARDGDKVDDRVDRIEHYLEPGVLWWAFDATSATRRGVRDELKVEQAPDPGVGPDGNGAVVLIDEIDKADPDVPNNLLESLGSLQFTVDESRGTIAVRAKTPPLVIITTNDERELPAAFLRRCVMLFLAPHAPDVLLEIAVKHLANGTEKDEAAVRTACVNVAAAFERLGSESKGRDDRRAPSTAEYLDAVRAWRRLEPGGRVRWADVEQLTLAKIDPFAKA